MGHVASDHLCLLPSAAAAAATPCRWGWLGGALADLGVVLYVYAHRDGRTWLAPQAPWPARRELVGLVSAQRVVASVAVGSDGPHECLRFLDEDGSTLATLWLLADSDFLAWETLLAALPGDAIARDCAHLSHVPAHSAQARVMTLARSRIGGIELLDAHTPQRLSSLGLAQARRLAAEAHAVLDPLPHDCCCQRAAAVV